MASARLRVEALIAAAEAQAGLSIWGADAEFRVGLDVLVRSAESADLPAAAIAALERQIVNLLAIRLHFVDDERKYPQITAQKIRRPLILTGLPRTGTTILHDLCALDPQGRAPQEWETARPWPAPDVVTYTTDSRIAAVQAELDALVTAMPALRAMHPFGATLPSDCQNFFALSFVCAKFVANFHIPTYSQWLATARPQGVYRTHKRTLQQLQWRGPQGRWILKEPQHLLDLQQLIETYPDACIVQTHRDPARTLASNASLVWTIQSILKPHLPKGETGRQMLELFGSHLERSTIARQAASVDSRVLDIAYRDTVLDPIATVRRIHEHFDFQFSDAHAHRIEQHIAHNPQGKHGAHNYSAVEFGLDQAALKNLMPQYRERFGHLLAEPSR